MPLPRPDGRLTVDRLVYLPPGVDRPVLKGISFSLDPGETLGIIGPSAAGKSTLARLLVGIWEPTAGGIYLDGHSTFLWERESFGVNVGYLPQNVSLLDGTIRENISRMTDASPADVVQAAKMADVHEMIGRLPFGYDTTIGDSAYSLSGGQRQRIGLARALFGNPRLLVLDEPNSNLDNAGEQALLTAIAKAKAAGTTRRADRPPALGGGRRGQAAGAERRYGRPVRRPRRRAEGDVGTARRPAGRDGAQCRPAGQGGAGVMTSLPVIPQPINSHPTAPSGPSRWRRNLRNRRSATPCSPVSPPS